MLITTSFLIVAGKKPQKPEKNYLELPQIEQPTASEDGFIVYCDNANEYWKH